MKKVAIFGEYASDNLGDRLIGACVKYIFTKCNDEGEVELFDWRTFEKIIDEKKLQTKKTLYSRVVGKVINLLPNFLTWRFIYVISKYRFERIIKDFDLVVVGGGQLLMDNGLVFPSRMYALVRAAYSLNKKITIVGVGVGDSWSDTGRDLLIKSISSEVVSQVIVRDSSSLIKLTSLVPEMKFKFEKSYDAAFFSREVFPELDKSNAMSERVGVGVINPAAIHRHSDNEYLASPAAFDFWLQLLVTLTKSGNKVSIFTNGEQGDYVFASLIYDRFISDYPNLSDMLLIEKRPLSLVSFVEIVSGYRVIVAARMHSNILAMSLNIPAYALAWDQKISNLYTDIELSDYVSSYSFNANSICRKLQSLESEFIEFESAVSKGIRSDILKKYSISLLS